VIAVAHKKGGTGKTTTATNVAVELSKSFDLTVLDFDSLQQLTKFNNRRSKKLKQLKVDTIEELKRVLSIQKDHQHIVLIDLGGYDSDFSRIALLLSDLVITPLSDSDNDIDGLVDFTEIMDQVQQTQKNITINNYILANRLHWNDKSTHKAFKSFASSKSDLKVFDTIITQNSVFKRMLSTGKGVSELTNEYHKANKQVRALIEEIKGLINE
jgi:chromosome partitioning protein